jgi:ABC-type polysaccharide/polyol phosphate transport system ATPase subunit/2-polyprenyl-3-methyl-5-hydroxy-6-metoxy-1,4-benzoquinol methylase
LLTEFDLMSETNRTGAPDSHEAVIHLEQVAVEYRAPRERIRTFKEYAIRLLKGGVKHEEFRALRGVSLDIYAGEVFGVIGHNGAGKSTLLKVVSRVLRPTRGRVVVRGRVAPLLELGAGFHPELSGRENVFLNGTLLGYTRAEIKAMFADIVDFAELWDFIDAPLRTYSTGMGMRLGFAVATAVRPDILLVDEVLSVGDERFQEKCTARMTEFRQSGTTIMLVTHDTRLVLNICDRALLLDHGNVGALGAVDEVVEAYHKASSRPQSPRPANAHTDATPPAKRHTADAPAVATGPSPDQVEEQVLEKIWSYPFDLPSGSQARCQSPPEIARLHEIRWQMLHGALEPLCDGGWQRLSCLDLGCHQGYFALKLARLGCRNVIGVDANAAHISDADLLRRAWGFTNLHFHPLDALKISPKDIEPSDVVLVLGLLDQLENPIGALRLARSLAKQAVIVETTVTPDQEERITWGAASHQVEMHGSFAVLDTQSEIDAPSGGSTPISLCPSREALVWIMHKLGFTRVEVLPPPPSAHEQQLVGQRVMVIGYV